MKMTGNSIFITGGGTGIGQALARAFHQLGNKVIIAGRRQAPLMETAEDCPGMAFHEIDMRDPASIERVAAWLIKHHPDVNVLVNNAGIMSGDKTGSEMDDQKTVATVETNLLGPIRMTSALIEHLKMKPDAAVINVTSGLAFTPLAHSAVYSATKAALHSWTMSLRVRLKGSSVRVLELAPPWVQTDLTGSRDNPRAMKLDDFIKEAMEKLATDADEILVDRVRMLRDNPGPDEWAFVEQFNGVSVH
ncbi:SDR family NAD(P)-dependent oxidoreductase [Rhodoblastus acidophilus]|uniref:SDR family NAD(P)-dependent oxidoreductase n=1 Tax=Candidatus Rhodoblastus alkanivorans TaxID=2954117 RepID=A0ABS9Z4A7_9HYPH|nr:SDR family NAD(P)-dependent oxidoreductase [Candidatus Rhodoblastus alkanivorans]MCI4680638.1 SDR family NAD(P)-dependent oxidoreductase [Candidatus Rhodoblastus alkanivorans]MCI4682510.1 SDR family NAD(P)-dependent oxidoreductase [Candidatus Rhodoblastus alkanivorans]MDI4639816.1 SDR family NAD(P)-dependent oxidoreductase [Rhodoblastus acidophilus]